MVFHEIISPQVLLLLPKTAQPWLFCFYLWNLWKPFYFILHIGSGPFGVVSMMGKRHSFKSGAWVSSIGNQALRFAPLHICPFCFSGGGISHFCWRLKGVDLGPGYTHPLRLPTLLIMFLKLQDLTPEVKLLKNALLNSTGIHLRNATIILCIQGICCARRTGMQENEK